MQAFYQHMMDLIESIEDCKTKCRLLPCLTLLYSGMDVMASLDSVPDESNQASFVRWVDRYLLSDGSISCAALDIYAARCGVVHAFSADSKLHRDGRANRICYAWGIAKAEDLKRASAALGYQDLSLHIDDLVIAFRRAVANHLDMIESDALARERFDNAIGMWFSNLNRRNMDDFLKIVG